MDYIVEILDESHATIIEDFTCAENDDNLIRLGFNSKERRKIRKHNNEMDRFLQKEALLEQSKNLNTTHMFLNKDKTELIAFVSICNDCIPLELDEKEGYGFTYATIPSLKVARLAINSKFQGRKFYNTIFQYVIYQALTIRNYAGLVFITLDCFKHRKSFYMKKLGFIENKKQNFTKAFDPPTSMRISIDDYLETIV